MIVLILQLIGIAGVAVGLAVAFFGARQEMYILIGMSSAISGVLFLAIARGLDLLQDIADALQQAAKTKKAE